MCIRYRSNTANYFQYNDDTILKILKLGDVSSDDVRDMKEKGAIILDDGGDVQWLLKQVDDTAMAVSYTHLNAFKRGITGKEKRNRTEEVKRPGFATRPASFSAQVLFFMPASRTQPGLINRSCFKSRLVIMAVPHPWKHRFQLPAALRRLPPRSQAAPVWLRRRS